MSDEQKNLAVMVVDPKPKRAPTLYFIVAVKFVKGWRCCWRWRESFRWPKKT